MNKMIKSDKDVALEFVSNVRCYLSNAAKSFFKIGYELHKAQEGKHYKALGYDSLEDLAEDAFGFSKTTTYDMLKVYNGCKRLYAPEYMREEYEKYSFSQLAAMQTGRYAGVSVMVLRVKPTDSVREIKKYVSYFNKYTDKHSGYPSVTLQEWLKQEEERQEQIESSEQLQLGELVEEVEDEPPTEEKFRTSGLREFAENEETGEAEELSAPEEIEEIEEEELKTECVSQETETSKYNFSCRAGARAFMADYKNWEFLGNCGSDAAFFIRRYRFMANNYDMFFALEVLTCKGIDEEGIALDNEVDYYLKPHIGFSAPFKITKEQLEKYIAAHADEL